MSNIKVAVRIRPLNDRELKLNVKDIVLIPSKRNIAVINSKVPENHAGDSRERIKRFSFDFCFGPSCTQNEIYEKLGGPIMQSVENKYNTCVLAYGQSATGKTYTMMGNNNDPGLTPRLCKTIFKNLILSSSTTCQIFISFLEIYNERVHDLLGDENQIGKLLRVREHPKRGPYVEGLKEHAVNNVEELLFRIERGESFRRVASTLTNKCSSRSHSVLTITFNFVDPTYGKSSHNQLHLVDLAGSERASSVQNSSCQLKEGANINRSLVALGNVISALADTTLATKHGNRFVPYRDSMLTWLLKETLGGNSNTFMIATISPSSSCYSETVNTLRFGQRAKHIVNEPIINEDPAARIIRELRKEVAFLKNLLLQSQFKQDVLNMGSILQQIKGSNDSNSPVELNNATVPDKSDDIASDSTQITSCDENSPSEPIEPIPNFSSQTTYLDANIQEGVINSTLLNNSAANNVAKIKNDNLRRASSALEIRRNKNVNAHRYKSHETLPGKNLKPHDNNIQNKRNSNKLLIPNIHESNKTLNYSNDNLSEKMETFHPKNESNIQTLDHTAKDFIKEAIRKHQQNKRSEIVASVTERLYAKARKKSTNSDLSTRSSSSSLISDLSANARNRLQEISFKAINANKRTRKLIFASTQTDLEPTIRVKEVAIDSQFDLGVLLELKKDMCTETFPDVQSIAVGSDNCLALDKIMETETPALKLRRSCGNLTDSNDLQCNNYLTANTKYMKTKPLSFTKYITHTTQTTDSNILLTLPHINSGYYKTSVNINFNLDDSSPDGSISDDSLDGNIFNKTYQTPDLLNNHSSDTLLTNQDKGILKKQFIVRTNYAIEYCSVENFETARERIFSNCSYCHAWPTIENNKCTATAVVIQTYRVEYCKSEINYQTNTDETVNNYHTQYNPKVAIILEDNPERNDEIKNENIPKKHLHCQCLQRTEHDINNHLLTTSTINLLNEATYFFCNLSEMSERCQHCKKNTFKIKDTAVQTNQTRPITTNATGTNTENFDSFNDDFIIKKCEVPNSKWEKLLQMSCDRLENKIIEIEQNRQKNSMLKINTASDRRKVVNQMPSTSFSPRLYLQELQKIRKELVDESRKNIVLFN